MPDTLLTTTEICKDEDVVRLSPLGYEHIYRLGRYAFTPPDPVARGELRLLCNPKDPAGEEAWSRGFLFHRCWRNTSRRADISER